MTKCKGLFGEKLKIITGKTCLIFANEIEVRMAAAGLAIAVELARALRLGSTRRRAARRNA